MKLSPHFSKEEYERSTEAARRGIDNTIPPELVWNASYVCEQLEIVRAYFNLPVRITSGYRCPALNFAIGGAAASAHGAALAADIQIIGINNIIVAQGCLQALPNFDQLICEFGPAGWTHVSFARENPRMQMLTSRYHEGLVSYTPVYNL